MALVKVEGYSSLRKDSKAGAIINSDISALRSAQKRKSEMLREKEKVTILENKVNTLELLVKSLIERLEKDNNGTSSISK